MKRFICTTATLLLSGCGSYEVQAPAPCTDEAVCAVCEDGADCDAEAATQASSDSESPTSGADGDHGATSVGATVVIPAAFATDPDDPLPDRSTDIDSLSSTLPFLDPFELSLLTLAEIDVLLSLFVDGLVLDLLTPADLNNELSFLERLCRQGDTPEFRCRQRFGE